MIKIFRTTIRTTFFFLLMILLVSGLYLLGRGTKQALSEELIDKDRHLHETLDLIESRFISVIQLASSTASLVSQLPLDKAVHEEFLEKIFESSLTSFVYGIGI
ncbi:MAG: hypothetical protein JEY99_18520 [Spirochaetales bacterium]|nr:hypothetical protein [Spirochaetales bacterium]